MLGIMRGGRLLWISLVVQVKNLTGSAGEPGDVSLISGSGRSRREGNGNLFQYFAGKFHGWRSLAGYIQSEKWKWKLLSPVWLCDPMDCTFHGILQARILEWVAFSFSRGSSQPSDWTQIPTLQVDSLPAEPQWKPTGLPEKSLKSILTAVKKSLCRLDFAQRLLPTPCLNLRLQSLHINQPNLGMELGRELVLETDS